MGLTRFDTKQSVNLRCQLTFAAQLKIKFSDNSPSAVFVRRLITRSMATSDVSPSMRNYFNRFKL